VLASHSVAVLPGSRTFTPSPHQQLIRASVGCLDRDIPKIAGWLASSVGATWD
jgi:hypothetical protein